MKKYFTTEEANHLLPVMEKELIALQEIKNDFETKYRQLLHLKERQADHKQRNEDNFFQLEASMDFLQFQAQTHIQNIRRQGILLKDIDLGLIDFPTVIDGEEVLLCWKLGEEKKIKYYHGMSEGYIGRKPIDEETLD